jgi:glycosyltransferase involved in cell wall biosynthesis
LPLALVEAMACRCCPIAGSVGGVPEVVVNDTLGWVVQPGDDGAFLAAMQAAAALDPAERAAMGARAREHVAQHFNAARQFAALADVIEGSIAQVGIPSERTTFAS